MKESLVETLDKRKCTGCKMCGDICPKQAISFVCDEKGFWYPVIDKEKCINCGLCEKKCPAMHPAEVKIKEAPVVYAAWSKDEDIRHNSTSGGIFWEAASVFIEKGGVVAGSRYGEDWKSANHFLAHNKEELAQLRGSKYFQSDTRGIYIAVEEELKAGKDVLFCGTPCQNAALSMFLGEKYTNIFYMDFICRSINSPLAFRAYISELEEKYNSSVEKVHLKNKNTGWQSLASFVCFKNGDQSHRDRTQDDWMKGFLQHDLYTRDCCYECQYRSIPRKTADMTIGDFWGIKGENSINMHEGISVVLLNSPKARNLFDEMKKNLVVKEKVMEDVFGGNPALLQPPKESDKSDLFFALLAKKSFSSAVAECLGEHGGTSRNIFSVLKEAKDMKQKYDGICEVSIKKYIYYNYYCKNIIRYGKAKLIPEKHAILDLHDTAKIKVYGDENFLIGVSKLKKSKAETYIRMGRDSVWYLRRGGALTYECTLEIHENAVLDTGYFTMNARGTMVVDKKVTLGEDVMMARNVIIYDSDFHQILDYEERQTNPPQEVIIGDRVWLGAGVTVLKGARIASHSVVGAGVLVTKNNSHENTVGMKHPANWKRKECFKYSGLYECSQIILFGYGLIGKRFEEKYRKQIAYIVDNRVKEEKVYTFSEFLKSVPLKLEADTFIWVIASPNYYEELYHQVKKEFPEMMVVPAEV